MRTFLASLSLIAACVEQSRESGAIDAALPVIDAAPQPIDARKVAARDAAFASEAAAVIDAATAPHDEWTSYGRDLAQTRDNPSEKTINVRTVAALRRSWTWEKGAAVTSTVAYVEGTLYFGDWQGYAVALDAKTGSERWRVLLPNQTVKQVTGSVTVAGDALYVGSDVNLYKLSRGDGSLLWSTKVAEPELNAHVYSSPAVVQGHVVSGVASYQNVNPVVGGFSLPPFQGSVFALDSTTGKESWRFTLTSGQGVGVTSSAAIDLVRRRVFIGTGNNYDDSDSPYADSLIALSLDRGEYMWHRQFTTADEFSLLVSDGPDHDVLATPLLFRAGEIDMVAAGDKGGSFFVFDREGNLQWAKKLTPGGHHGGVMGSAAYANGAIFVCSGDFTQDSSLGLGQDGPMASLLIALRARDGEQLWSKPLAGACYGGISHAGGVVYLPTVGGEIQAYAADTGTLLWSDKLPASSAGGVTVANGMLLVPYGWDWIDVTARGGLAAYSLL